MPRDFWRRHPRLSAATGLLVGLVVMIMGFGGYPADRSLNERGVETDAVVEDVKQGRDVQYEVRFTLPDGEVVTARTDFASGGSKVGDRIGVEYDPQDPEIVSEVGSREGALFLSGGIGLVGLAVTGHAGWRLLRPRRQE